jgi:Domain of unknown function (DUF5615)
VKVRFLADADLNFDIVTGVCRKEPAIDFRSAQDALTEGMNDNRVLALAAAEGRILVSHDVSTMPGHFARFLEEEERSPGVILRSQVTPISECIEELVLVWVTSEPNEWKDRLTFLPL